MTAMDEELNQILKKLRGGAEPTLLPDEINNLVGAFLSTRQDITNLRPKAYVCLSALCQAFRNSKKTNPEGATRSIVSIFQPKLNDLLSETAEQLLLNGIDFLTALFQVDSSSATVVFSAEGVVENVMDTIDLTSSQNLYQAIAHLLSQAAGYSLCRPTFTPQIIRWLELNSNKENDVVLRGSSTLALVKYAKGAANQGTAAQESSSDVHEQDMGQLTDIVIGILSSEKLLNTVDAIEGLAYLSTDPAVKERVVKNQNLLKTLFSLVPTKKPTTPDVANSSTVYGVLTVLQIIVAFKPQLTEEQKHIEKLKEMSKPSKASITSSTLDDDVRVKARIRQLLDAGVLPVFPRAIVAVDSAGIRIAVGRCLLSFVEEKENRGKVLQAGGSKVLQTILKYAVSNAPAKDNLDPQYLPTIQALAKLSITSSPVQVFGPNVGAMLDMIRPLSILLQHPSSSLLQRFEAIMGLTNLSSHSAELASRVVKADGLVDKIETLMLEDHVLVRRAATELVCNLIAGSDELFEIYGDGSSRASSKLHVLLALSDVEDVPTRLAASGALATLTTLPSACHSLIDLQLERHKLFSILAQMVAPSPQEGSNSPVEINPGLVQRAVFCVNNIFKHVPLEKKQQVNKEANDSQLLVALFTLVKNANTNGIDPQILGQAVDAVKTFSSS
ncbi:ARM repeat-containing protein [Panaeolus papilionaceus]|nr:ARM repeat-containing protein [Panaeolus papilionaceus]